MLTLKSYETHALGSLRLPGSITERRFALTEGVFAECGSILSVFKRKSRGELAGSAAKSLLCEELGDCLWYATALASYLKVDFRRLINRALRTATDMSFGGSISTFEEAEAILSYSNKFASLSHTRILASIGAVAGQLFANISRDRTNLLFGVTASSKLLTLFIALLFTLSILDGIPLDKVASANIKKRDRRFPAVRDRIRTILFDASFDADEQFPRIARFQFHQKTLGGRHLAFLTLNGVRIGDALTDNRDDPDAYRFHDVFHLAYAAILGWSPVTRGLLRCKRKSVPTIDENQDGARAAIIEEAISTIIFNSAEQHGFFAFTKTVDYRLLKTIDELTKGYEVSECKMWEWEEAILQGFEAFQSLKKQEGGFIEMNLHDRKLTYSST